MKTAFLFSGQGSQYVGMGLDLYQNSPVYKATLDSFNVPFDFKSYMFKGPETTLNDTAYTQACLVAMELSIVKMLEVEGIIPDVVAGLSLGEYSALATAHRIEPQTAIDLVVKRGALMSECAKSHEGVMLAVLGVDIDVVRSHLIEGVYISNDNCPKQVIVGGEKENVKKFETIMSQIALKCVYLTVSGAFHTPYFKEAANSFEEDLKQVQVKDASIPVIANVTGAIFEGDFVSMMTKQIMATVRFRETIETMIEMGVDCFVEIGPTKILSQFVKKTNRSVKTFHIESMDSFNQTIKEIKHD